MKRAALMLGALACFALAAGLFLLAADVWRWRDALPADDVRYRVAPEEPDLWRPAETIPLGMARDVLALDDDVAFRQALRALRLGRLEDATVSDPSLALHRSDAQARLLAVADGGDVAQRRSRAAGLLGVISFASTLGEVLDRETFLQEAITSYRKAIALDAENAEAKFNLELALQRGRGIQPSEGAGGQNPTPGGAGAKGAGAGDPGSGY